MVQISKSFPPKEPDSLKKEFVRGQNLFQNAMQEYCETSEPHKKAQLQKVLNETKEAMNQIINDALHERGDKIENKIQSDYKEFLSNANVETMAKLKEDLDSAKRML